MPSMKKMKRTTIGKKAQFDTNTTNPTATKGGGPKGFAMSNPSKPTMGAGRHNATGKAMGTRKGGGGRSY
jgi:hypothetical protein